MFKEEREESKFDWCMLGNVGEGRPNLGLILGDDVEIHAKGMREALRCRELLGHEDHPELVLEEEETSCTTLAEPVSLYYVRLTDKHLDQQMRPATSLHQHHASV